MNSFETSGIFATLHNKAYNMVVEKMKGIDHPTATFYAILASLGEITRESVAEARAKARANGSTGEPLLEEVVVEQDTKTLTEIKKDL